MKKLFVGLILSLASLVSFAKPIAEVKLGDGGKLYLDDTQCVKTDQKGVGTVVIEEKDGKRYQNGCWMQDGEIIYLVNDNGMLFQASEKEFTWIKHT
jgi:hypothetical protein